MLFSMNKINHLLKHHTKNWHSIA